MPEPIEIELVPASPPAGRDLLADGRRLGRAVEIGQTAFLHRMELPSERAYRERGRERGQVFTACNIGMSSWAETADALRSIEDECLRRAVRPPDHWQFIPQRRLGLPKPMRAGAPSETGPMLWTDADWRDWATAVSWMQPEAGDNIIGSPASVENAIDAMRAGSTYIGCLSQFWWRWPYFDDDVEQVSQVVRACAVVGSRSADGLVLDSYLEDGLAGVFMDYASLVGWSLVERWVARMTGAKLSVAWGGLTSDPWTKSVVTIALELLNRERIPAAFVQGDTIGYTEDLDRNAAVCARDVLFMMAVATKYRTGAAILPVPLSEVSRTPSWQEIAQVQVLAREVERGVPSTIRTINWPALEAEARRLASEGRRFFRNVKSGLDGLGVNTTDPFQVLIALRRLGATRIETAWGVGSPDPELPHGRRPYLPTELLAQTIAERDESSSRIAAAGVNRLAGMTVVVASTDVHEMGKTVLIGLLARQGARAVDGGLNRDPEDVRDLVRSTGATAVVVTTHNGVAWTFGSTMRDLWATEDLQARIFMGGVLNENLPGSPTPTDVTARLVDIGISIPGTPDRLVDELAALRSRSET